MTKRGVVKYSIKLFHIQSELSMVFRFQLNQRDVLQKVQKVQKVHHANFNFLNKIQMILSFLFRTKLELAYISTQGIENIDVIDRTKLRKLGYLSSKKEIFNHLISLCVGYDCGITNIKSEKIEIQPLNMVLSKN